jgi:molecular chaperone DnaJ
MSSSKRDYYEVLIISRTASQDDVKQAFRKLAKEYHPDRNPGDAAAEDKFKEIQEAFSVLHDAEKRRRYDRMGHAAFGGGDSGSYERVDFRAVSEILEGLVGEVFGRGAARRARQGADIEVELTLTFEEAALGVEKMLSIERLAPCPTCNATGAAPGTKVERCSACNGVGEVRFQRGFFSASRPCSTCGGTGKRVATPCPTCAGRTTVPAKEEMLVRVPPGVEDGAIRSVRGGGERASSAAGGGGTAGDLHVKIKIAPHPLFSREGADVKVTVPISFPEAVLGTQVDVPTLEGKVKMKVPPGTQSGKLFRIRGKGIEVFGGAGKGDQIVIVLVEVPEQITKKQRQLIEELAAEFGEDVSPQQKSFLDKLRGLFE